MPKRIRRDLRTPDDPACAVTHKLVSGSPCAVTHVVRNAQFGICINRRPSPNIAPAVRLAFWIDVFALRSDKRPYLIALRSGGREDYGRADDGMQPLRSPNL